MIKKEFILIFFTSIFLVSCSQKNNILDTDLSNLPRPKPKLSADNRENEIERIENKKFIRDLVTFKDKEKLLSEFQFGKKDPFSVGESQLNRFLLDFEINGFLNTEGEKFVFVNYLGKKGTISEESIGGLNTNLLPNGAKVINIDSKKMQLRINFDNEDFIFEL